MAFTIAFTLALCFIHRQPFHSNSPNDSKFFFAFIGIFSRFFRTWLATLLLLPSRWVKSLGTIKRMDKRKMKRRENKKKWKLKWNWKRWKNAANTICIVSITLLYSTGCQITEKSWKSYDHCDGCTRRQKCNFLSNNIRKIVIWPLHNNHALEQVSDTLTKFNAVGVSVYVIYALRCALPFHPCSHCH